MNIQLRLFQDEEDEPSHSLMFDVPSIPLAGDRVTISRPGQEGYTSYIVRRRQWDLDLPSDEASHRADEKVIGNISAVIVECMFTVGPYSSEEHK